MLALVAAVLAAIPLLLSRLDADGDLDPFFAVLVLVALFVALAATRERGSPARRGAMLLAVAWLGAGAAAAFLLVMYQTACGCSTPDLSAFPPTPTYLGFSATTFHLIATYGGGPLVALAAFLPPASAGRTRLGD
jgi:Trk-type K+ transport system membrane component